MENNNIEYKWKKLFASMRFDTDTGVIFLTPKMQQELIDDISTLMEVKENDSLHSVSVSDSQINVWAESYKEFHCENKEDITLKELKDAVKWLKFFNKKHLSNY